MKKTSDLRPEQTSSLYKYFQKFLMVLLKWIIENEDALIRDLGYLINLKKVFRRYIILIILVIVSFALILGGIGLFIESLFTLPSGLVNILIGIILIIIALICKKLWKIHGV